MHRLLHGPGGGGGGDDPGRGRRRGLPFRVAVDHVVHDDVRHVHIPPDRVDQVIEADPVSIAVAPGREHHEVAVGQLDPGRDRQRPPVVHVEPVRPEVRGDLAGAPDARHEDDPVRRHEEPGAGLLEGAQDGEVAASGAPRRPVPGEGLERQRRHAHAPAPSPLGGLTAVRAVTSRPRSRGRESPLRVRRA